MPFSSDDAHLPRRNARSFDLDDSAAKAAAWVWHLHTSKPGITTEGRVISSQISRRRSSGNYDRKASRFQQEALTTTNTVARRNNTETPMWDCGSNLYDTFELVAFGNRLDRSLMEVVPIRPPQAHPQEHHMKSPLHKPSGILRTLSLPRSLLPQQTSKNCAAISCPKPDEFELSKSYNDGTRARSTSSGEKASSMGKLMSVIKKVMVLHKQVSFLGCKRSTNVVVECSQRPLGPISEGEDNECTRDNQFLVNGKVRANCSTRNNRGNDCMGDELSIQYTRVRSKSDSISNSIPIKSDYETNFIGAMQEKVSRGTNSASLGKKIRSKSKRMSDGLLEHKSILRARRKLGRDLEGVNVKERIKGSDVEGGSVIREGIKESDLGGGNVREMIKGANDLHKHLHHHHHHHHHHYLHHNLGSESARLSPETMSHICAEQSWLL